MGKLYDATWGRGFAAVYDRAFEATEEAGLREMRRELLAGASGRTVDVGAGTGANIGLFPPAVTELLFAEPDPHMVKRLRAKLSGVEGEVLQAPAERLPLEDSSIDTVAFTLVLCTVPNPTAALAEAARILRPGGKLLFLEHVRSEDAGLARWQDRLEKPWRFLADGCHCNRDTVATIETSAFAIEKVEKGSLPKAPPLVRPLVGGSATRIG
jgi:ubiquinone/menaquinone biosynthesis C-methylase UbiE